MSPKVFISYRRNDVPQVAKQMYSELVRHFPKEDVFMDVDSIQYGSNFLASIEQHIILADIVLVLIGPRYNGQPGERRLMKENDFVRLELELALRHQKRILPILIGSQTQIPLQTELPPSLFHLPFINAVCFPTAPLSKQDLNQTLRFLSSTSQPFSSGKESIPTSLTNTASPLIMVQQSDTPSLRTKQRQERFQHQRQFSLKPKFDGIIAIGAFLLIVGVAFLRGWNIAWWYFVLTILGYTLFLLFNASFERFSKIDPALRNSTFWFGPFRIKHINKVQLWLRVHLIFILLVGGLWLNPGSFLVQAGIFAASVVLGQVPFFVFRFEYPEPTSVKVEYPVVGHLIVVDSGPSKIAPGTTFNLHPQTTIGRGPTNIIQISESFLSAEHTRLWFRSGAWYVQDAGSTNGTFLNNAPARDALLAHEGDIIQVGFIRFKLAQ